MGGGLAFLNKKGWHPGSMRNQETVWKREQERDTEDKKLEEFRQHVEQERQKEELDGIARAAGVKKQSDRLDWMYQGGMVARTEADKRSESAAQQQDQALPAGVPVQADQGPAPQVELPSFLVEDNPASANEVWLRLHSDPLFGIRQQEIAARKAVLANPVQMDAVRKQALLAEQAKAARKAAKKQVKQAKKDKKAARKAAKHSKEPPSSDSEPEADAARPNGHARSAPAEASTRDRPEGAAEPRHKGQHDSRRENGRDDRGHSDRRPEARGRDAREHGGSSRDRPRSRPDNGHAEGHRADDRDPRSRDRADGARDHADGRSSRDAAAPSSSRDAAAPSSSRYRPSAGDPKQERAYGLKLSEAAAGLDRSAASAATRQRLEEAAVAKEEQKRLDAANKYVRKDYRTNQLSEEDKARKLAEMTGNASVHEEARWQRLSSARKRDHAEAVPAEDGHDAEKFRKVAAQQVQGSQSVEQGVGRRKYYSERDSDKAAFRR